MNKKNADKILKVISPHMDRLGLQYAEAVPLDFLSKDVFLELGITAPTLSIALKKHINHSCSNNEIVQVSQKHFIDTINQFMDIPLGYNDGDDEEVEISMCQIG